MKLRACLMTAAALVPGAWPAGADEKKEVVQPVVSFDIKHDVSPPLRLMRAAPPRPMANKEIPMGKVERKNGILPPALLADPLLRESEAPEAPMPPPLVSFEGTSDDDNQAVLGGRVVPSDTNGDVGPNHYVQFNNQVFEVFSKTGTPLLGPLAGNTPWAGFGGPCQTTNNGDPIALYDQLADRWILSQFAINSGIECVAVSTTPDPTGTYFRYAFNVTPGGQNDYPKIGVWPDAYYSSYRRFPGSSFRIVAAAFERTAMLTGGTARLVTFDIVPPSGLGCLGAGDCYDGILPSHLEGMVPPPAGTPGLFVTAFDDEFNQGSGGGTPNPTQDFYKIWKFHVDFVTPLNSTLTGPINVAAPEFDENLCSGNPCVPQPAPGELLDHLSFFTMYRPSYRNLGDHAALVVNNTVNVGSSRAGVRWAEIRDPAGTPTLFQTGTYAPPDAVHRWMGSTAMDASGNIALGFSASSASLFPSIRYVGRLAGDPPGTLPQTEVDLIAGAGAQLSNSFNRWGDYSAMGVEESDGCTFWYTTEYYANSATFDFKTRIGAFKFPSCLNVPVQPAALAVDASGNRVFQPNETVAMDPSWRNMGTLPIALTGALSAFTGPVGPTYTIVDGAANYGTLGVGNSGNCSSQGNCYSLTITSASRPTQHWDATALETLTPTSTTKNWVLHIGDSFTDVPASSGFYRFIETIFHKGVTGGCGTNVYCPSSSTTREQMAVFVLVSKEGSGYTPVACGTPMFADVPASSPFCPYIEELARRGVVSGCGGGNYCPQAAVSRDTMAVFVLATLNPTLNPPACGTPVYNDVPASNPFCRWIEELTRRGVVTGCGGGSYCPTQPVTREQMGVFLTATFSLLLYGV